MSNVVRLDLNEIESVHGFQGNKSWPAPRLVASSDKACRPDQGNSIKANEYLDEPEVLEQKMKLVAQLVRKSKWCVAYTGAGLSRSSGIPDYASKASNSVVGNAPKLTSSLDASPTYAHRVIASMERAGHIKHYVQQNHDGLPQKAGFPQEKINEIHGAWFDPSNPVVQFSGSLRGDLFQWMLDMEKKTDLCLCLGTSLSGMNADRMATTPAKKSLAGKALGTVVINLQQTPLDAKSCVRVWARLDDAFAILARELALNTDPIPITVPDTGDVFVLPYNEKGERDQRCRLVLDLRVGQHVKIAVPGACNANATGKVVYKTEQGDYSIQLDEQGRLVRRLFGRWWIDAAMRGAVDMLPVINTQPRMADSTLPSMLRILQSHRTLDNGNHSWGLCLDADSSRVVSSVVWKLHSTFKNPERTVVEPPFKIE